MVSIQSHSVARLAAETDAAGLHHAEKQHLLALAIVLPNKKFEQGAAKPASFLEQKPVTFLAIENCADRAQCSALAENNAVVNKSSLVENDSRSVQIG
jgi:hypothetical protein